MVAAALPLSGQGDGVLNRNVWRSPDDVALWNRLAARSKTPPQFTFVGAELIFILKLRPKS